MNAPLRLGVIGCGRVFQRFHLPAIDRTPGVELVAACDSDPKRLATHSQRLSPSALFTSLDPIIDHGSLDAVLVLTPPASHAAVAVRMLEAGIHVLVEKPMALTREEGLRMIEAAVRSRRCLQVGFNRRFRTSYRQARQRLQSGSGGRVVSGKFQLSFPSSSWHAWSNFLGDDRLGGGPLDDVLSHQIDLLSWLLGPPAVVRTLLASDRAVEVELQIGDAALVCQAEHGRYREHLELELQSGETIIAAGSSRFALLRDRLLGRTNPTQASFQRQLADFQLCIAAGKSEGATGEDGLLVTDTVQACRASARDGGSWRTLAPTA
jgi:predicted dehydrogenase